MAFALLEGILIQFLRTLKIQKVFSFHIKINLNSMISVVAFFVGFHKKSCVSIPGWKSLDDSQHLGDLCFF